MPPSQCAFRVMLFIEEVICKYDKNNCRLKSLSHSKNIFRKFPSCPIILYGHVYVRVCNL